MQVLIGIDDTDMPDTRGTNQLAREIVRRAAPDWRCGWIVRHQLFDDPRVPYTSKNGSASIVLANDDANVESLTDLCRETMREWFIPGSDPGLCVAAAEQVPPEIISYARRCQSELMTQASARDLARRHELHLEGLGGTEGGVIGALAAIGLAREGNSGRIVQWQEWPDDLSGEQSVSAISSRSITVREQSTDCEIKTGSVDVGKHLRPNVRQGEAVLFVCSRDCAAGAYTALKLL